MKAKTTTLISVTELAIMLNDKRDHVERRLKRLGVPVRLLSDGRNAKRYFRRIDIKACQELWADLNEQADSLGLSLGLGWDDEK